MGDTHIHIHNHAGEAVKAEDIDTPRVQKALASDELAYGRIVKAEDERRFTLGLAYPALKPDVAVAKDGHIDYVSMEALEKAAWGWMQKNRSIGVYHADGTEGSGNLVESYIWRADPWVVKCADGSEQTIREGDWLAGVVWSEKSWPMVKSGAIRGYSPQGGARRRVASESDLAKLRS
jgi:hypothetical protein